MAQTTNHQRHDSQDTLTEQSPLLTPSRMDDDIPDFSQHLNDHQDDSWASHGEQKSKSSWYMLLLTLGGLGLQMGWSVEMSNGSPYLLSLGLSKTLLALVWIAGPLSGVLVQPFVGLKSDRCRIRWGKRRPFIVGGTIATILSLMVLAWTREIVTGFLGLFGVAKDSQGVAVTIMAFAVLFIYVLDFAINVFQAALRAYIVDCAPMHQQDQANAWVSRMCGVGNIFGMMCSYANLPQILPFLGDTQFKVLCAIAAISMVVTVSISVTSIPERDPTLDGELPAREQGVMAFFRGLFTSITRLPTQISRICYVQFFAWMGWFPFLFYTTTYIGEIYVEPLFKEYPHLSEDEINAMWDAGTRRGALALLVFAIVTFTSSVVLPIFIRPTFQPNQIKKVPSLQLSPTSTRSLAGSAHQSQVIQPPTSRSRIESFQKRFSAVLDDLQVPGLTLRRAWFYSHILYTICMLCTFFVRDTTLATVLVGLVGIPWAMTQWAPFALISSEIAKRDAIRRGVIKPPPTVEGNLIAANEDDSADQAGVVLGIHNVAISAPQVIATLVSSLIFSIAAKPRGTPGDESVAWCLRFGGICAIIAAYLTTKVGEGDEGIRKEDLTTSRSGQRYHALEEEDY